MNPVRLIRPPCTRAAALLAAALLAGCGGPGHEGGVTEWFSAELRGLEQEEGRLKQEMAGLPALFPDQQT